MKILEFEAMRLRIAVSLLHVPPGQCRSQEQYPSVAWEQVHFFFSSLHRFFGLSSVLAFEQLRTFFQLKWTPEIPSNIALFLVVAGRRGSKVSDSSVEEKSLLSGSAGSFTNVGTVNAVNLLTNHVPVVQSRKLDAGFPPLEGVF